MKKNTIIALVVAVLAIAGTVVFLWQYDKKQNTAPEVKPEPTTPGTTPGTPSAPGTAKPPTNSTNTTPTAKNNYTDYEKQIAVRLYDDLDGINITHDMQLWFTLMAMSDEKIKQILNIYWDKYNSSLLNDLKSDVISFTDNYSYYKKIKSRLEALSN